MERRESHYWRQFRPRNRGYWQSPNKDRMMNDRRRRRIDNWGRLTVIIVVPYSFLNSLNLLPSTSRAITSRMSNGWRTSVPTIPWSSEAGYNGSVGVVAGCARYCFNIGNPHWQGKKRRNLQVLSSCPHGRDHPQFLWQ